MEQHALVDNRISVRLMPSWKWLSRLCLHLMVEVWANSGTAFCGHSDTIQVQWIHDWWTHFKQQIPWQLKPSGMTLCCWVSITLVFCSNTALHSPRPESWTKLLWKPQISQVPCQRWHSSEQGVFFRRNFRWYWSTLRGTAMEISRMVIPGRVPHSFNKFRSHLWIFGARWETSRKLLLSIHSGMIPEPQNCLALSARFLWTDLRFVCKKTNLW